VTGPPNIAEVPYNDPPGLERWVAFNPERVTPLILERLMIHNGFVEITGVPSAGAAKCVLWKHAYVDRYPGLAQFNFTVYYTDLIPKGDVVAALATLRGIREWQATSRIRL
jgi:hypothetical protein